uniref:Ferredoxin n=1 Tax=Candidatus Kentrum sp. DK TaxID=2126562 RepID=A0A450RX79_9GAMM|nr:MAG: ferredoxin [Candidatus Kentron sp. DK]VFJ49637.1 MAG: ferredoxin [Candidatus Kentron sp. DK]
MAYVVTERCRDAKFTDCVVVCPVDCFYELEKQLVIDPDECIDCAACEAECPVEAICAEDDVPDAYKDAVEFNARESARLRAEGIEPITEQKKPLPTAEEKKKQLGLSG